ncbi:unnamed protein product [Calypogeia fissa]
MAAELKFLAPALQVSKGESFASILGKFAYSFGLDEADNEILPPSIPLCRLQKLKLVRNLNFDGPGVSNVKESFMLHGYVEDLPGFQLLLVDDRGLVQEVTDVIKGTWDGRWRTISDQFDHECDANLAFSILKGRMFPVGDGNHHLFSWMEVAKTFPQENKYHPRVKAKFLLGSEMDMLQIVATLQAFNS